MGKLVEKSVGRKVGRSMEKLVGKSVGKSVEKSVEKSVKKSAQKSVEKSVFEVLVPSPFQKYSTCCAHVPMCNFDQSCICLVVYFCLVCVV